MSFYVFKEAARIYFADAPSMPCGEVLIATTSRSMDHDDG